MHIIKRNANTRDNRVVVLLSDEENAQAIQEKKRTGIATSALLRQLLKAHLERR
jgi:folate-dependent phosphoribosylglycinamide formyltransferase PurN